MTTRTDHGRVGLDASQLTQVIALSAPQSVSDGQGGYIETPMPLNPPTDFAAIEPATNDQDETPMVGTVLGTLSHRVRLRWRGDVTLQTQLTFVDWAHTTRRLWVRSLQNPKQQSDLLVLWCEEQTT